MSGRTLLVGAGWVALVATLLILIVDMSSRKGLLIIGASLLIAAVALGTFQLTNLNHRSRIGGPVDKAIDLLAPTFLFGGAALLGAALQGVAILLVPIPVVVVARQYTSVKLRRRRAALTGHNSDLT